MAVNLKAFFIGFNLLISTVCMAYSITDILVVEDEHSYS